MLGGTAGRGRWRDRNARRTRHGLTKLRRDEQQSAETYSHSVNPTGLYRFDAQGGLLSVVIPTADAVKSVEDFCSSSITSRSPSAVLGLPARNHSRSALPQESAAEQ